MDVTIPGEDPGCNSGPPTPSGRRRPEFSPETLDLTVKKELQQFRTLLMDDIRIEFSRLRMEISSRNSLSDPNSGSFQRVVSGGMNPMGSLASGVQGNSSFGFGLPPTLGSNDNGQGLFDEPHAWINRSMRSYCAAEELANIEGPGLESQERFSSKTTLLSADRPKGQGPWSRAAVGGRRKKRIRTAPIEQMHAVAAAAANSAQFTGSPIPAAATPNAAATAGASPRMAQPATLGALPALKKTGTSDFPAAARREHRAPTAQSAHSFSVVRREARGQTMQSANSGATADRLKQAPSPSPSLGASSGGLQHMSHGYSRSSSCAARILDPEARDPTTDACASFSYVGSSVGGLNFSERASERSPRSLPLPSTQLHPPIPTSEMMETSEVSTGSGGTATRTAGVHHLSTIASVPDSTMFARTLKSMKTKSIDAAPARKWALRIVGNIYFDYTTIVFIVANAVAIGLQTDYCARNLQESPPIIFERLEEIFFAFFTVELALRMYAHSWRFFYMPSWPWNLVDLFVISLQAVENLTFISKAGMDSALPLNLLRILRILRLIRVLRVVKLLRYMSELRTIIVSIMASMKALLSTILLLMLVIFIVACYITQLTLTSYLDCSAGDDCNMEDHFKLRDFCGSLGITILHLFQTVFGGFEWRHMVDPMITTISPLMGFLVCLYVVFTALALMNIVTGVFVETALQRGREDKDVCMINQLRDLFGKLDEYRSGTISWEQMAEKLSDPNLLTFFKDIDLDVSEARGLFHLLDRDGSGVLDADEFLSGCLRLRGPAKSLDIQLIMREISEQRRVMVRLAQIVCRANEVPTIVSTGFTDFLTPATVSGQETASSS